MTLYDTLNYSNFHFIKIKREREREREKYTNTHNRRPTPDARDIFNYKTKLTPQTPTHSFFDKSRQNTYHNTDI